MVEFDTTRSNILSTCVSTIVFVFICCVKQALLSRLVPLIRGWSIFNYVRVAADRTKVWIRSLLVSSDSEVWMTSCARKSI